MKVVSAVLRLGLPGIRPSESLAWDQVPPWTKKAKEMSRAEIWEGKGNFLFIYLFIFFFFFGCFISIGFCLFPHCGAFNNRSNG